MPLATTTVGVELEWADNITPLLQQLVDARLLAGPRLHDYHCRCEYCDFSEYPLAAQRDATCAGEIITRPGTLDDIEGLLAQIADAACAVDASTGLSAGMHVHVMPPGTVSLGDTIRWFVRYEDQLAFLARGPYLMLRSMNEWFQPHFERFPLVGPDASTAVQLRERAATIDRHANLATATRHHTYEFRIWNSTRVHWRMQLAVRASLALLTHETHTLLADATDTDLGDADFDTDLVNLLDVFTNVDETLGTLARQQADWQRAVLADTPDVFALSDVSVGPTEHEPAGTPPDNPYPVADDNQEWRRLVRHASRLADETQANAPRRSQRTARLNTTGLRTLYPSTIRVSDSTDF